MKKYSVAISFLLILAAIYWSFLAIMPQNFSKSNVPSTQFSTERALNHIKTIAEYPHYAGSASHTHVRQYLISELKKLGLETQIQEGYTAGDWGNLSKAINIIAKIKGSRSGKSLLLLSHYDSSPYSSPGASDAGSGIATILEGVRAFLATGKKPANDVIIVFSDAEELGLNGAELFVNKHPWAKNIGLILNFEARGSGGPGIMLVETNNGNAQLIKHFVNANPPFPMGNSLAYSIYKIMPNDTDLTVFRENANIQGFNFAFIDDHYDYHTVLDNYERLDRNTLEHQGTYLMPLLKYFSNTDLSALSSNEDYVYVNVPVFKLIYYPFSWIIPMLITAIIIFLILLGYGKYKGKLNYNHIFKGFIPFILSLVICGLIGFYGWPVIKSIYPHYKDNLHGFTYNGYLYITAFVFISITVCFAFYKKFKKINTVNLIVAPVTFWLIICSLGAIYLKGTGFFIIPVFGALVSFYILIEQEEPNLVILTLLAFPALWILSPLVQIFPVGLGLKTMIAVTLLVVLIFGLLLPVTGFYKHKGKLALLALFLGLGYFIAAHFQSDSTADRPKPNSLLYVFNADENKSYWATYNSYIDSWVAQYMGKNKKKITEENKLSSKYNTGYSFMADAPLKDIPVPEIEISNDTIIDNRRHIEICVNPQRNINRLEVFANTKNINECMVNSVPFSKEYLQKRKSKLFTHFVSNNNYTDIKLVLPENENLELTFYEASNNLLTNKLFSIPPRPENTIPMPFVLNDAIVVKKTIKF
ncbi:M20/M25/M40 family metallo-hydrolase [Abyssalbus ytuae]|uniref:Vacuolar membrane protease n=1 Tax=Abyssalbus ytuae TaxID=2926907 RepID=A0A9E6ZY87_9FLAO|nr:M20/M25/M40 family metallo-hydrolase [Abyssalbus ytuae]UOB16086.1 M20/M25/M40 family metallo-hydrolase [Abyssalbus ytuae]